MLLIVLTAIVALIMAGVIGINTRNIETLSRQNEQMLTAIFAQKKALEVMQDAEQSYSADIDEIISKLEAIAADIHRLDENAKQDHRDLVDIRERYVLWREPVSNAGVAWSNEIKCTDDEEQGNG